MAAILAGCQDAAEVELPGVHYRLVRVNSTGVPAEVERVTLGNNTLTSQVTHGRLQLSRADSAEFTLLTETVVYDPAGTPLTSEVACSNTMAAYHIRDGRLYLDLEFMTPPSQGSFTVSMHDTLTISGTRLSGNHKVVFGTSSLVGKVLWFEYVTAGNPVARC